MFADLAIVGAHIKLLIILYGIVDLACAGSSQVVIILSDEFCHALTGMLLWSAIIIDSLDGHFSLEALRKIFIRQFAGNGKELALAGFTSCALDVDHFIAAGSASLQDATNLPHRPFGHALAFVPCVSLLYYAVSRNSRTAKLLFVALLSHHLRDSMKRGLWLWPMDYSTPPIPFYYVFPMYLVLTWAMRLLMRCNPCRNEVNRDSDVVVLSTV
ncbi:hypothetical protein EON65_32135 [archaeon]|nr:MAG: hypothetical protein EON65_32135 [archaeon]